MTFIPLQYKAAGHDGSFQSLDGSLFIKPTTSQEVEFYNYIQHDKSLKDEVAYGDCLVDWVPEYIGTLHPGASDDLIQQGGENLDESLIRKAEDTLEIEGSDKQYLILKNILEGYSQPSVMDIKLGSILYDENSSPEKVKRMQAVSKTTTSGSLKFRIAGMIIKDDFNGKAPENLDGVDMSQVCDSKIKPGFFTFNRYFGRKLKDHNVIDALKIFFRYNNLPLHVQDKIIANFHTRLQMLYNCLLDEEIRVISGSLLFVFENDIKRWEMENFHDPIISPPTVADHDDEDEECSSSSSNSSSDEDIQKELSCLKLIDFAHAKSTPEKGYDEELVTGIENLFNIIGSL
ncbi:hypothetical protein CANINC_003009 [Pichia inconspicua]|uniref:Kinase n=1 Tax=Pichia inconspicua TaxID=52247 RepID=A0A4T0WZU2_9ASCO|nr:hypothetical protein CANINC_003009 [[Candida] inconspicua]